MNDPASSIDIVQVIQLAVAPVFLLSGVGITLTVLTNRLSRVVDRARQLENAVSPSDAADLRARQEQLRTLGRRARLINQAITLSTVCALLVALVVVALFVSEFLKLDLSIAIALLFVVGMLSFIVALLFFLREVFLAIAALKIGTKR